MSEQDFEALREDFMAAVRAAIDEIGMDAFKMTSFFGSNENVGRATALLLSMD